MNLLYERLRLQAHLRTLMQNLGEDQALSIIRTALEREIQYEDHRNSTEHDAHSLRNHTDLHAR